MTKSNDLIGVLLLISILYAVYYFANDCKHPKIPNEGEVNASVTDKLVNDFKPASNDLPAGSTYQARDEYDNVNGSFSGLPNKEQANIGEQTLPYSKDGTTPTGAFAYKGSKFEIKDQQSIKEELNSDNYLPKQQQSDWFDVEPIQGSKKIRGTHFIHPKVWHGVNTVGSSLRNASYDLRGNVPVPKINVSPWLNSTIDPDTNIMGICNPV